jgi:formate dehydrogenase major subunit
LGRRAHIFQSRSPNSCQGLHERKNHCRALVTARVLVLRFDWRNVYTTGLPYHFGPNGIITGDVVNDMPATLEANVAMHEAKAFTANLEKGRV